MKDNFESDQEDLIPSGKRELSTDRSDLYHRGLELAGNLKKKSRTINFPRTYSIGQLCVANTFEYPFFQLRQMAEPETVMECEAQGEVRIPEGNLVQLAITEDYPYSLSPLSQLSSNDLDVLSIWHSQITDSELKNLCHLTKLRELFLEYCGKITDSGILHLKNLSSLEELTIAGSMMGDKGLEHLQSLIALKNLRISDSQVTNFGLKSLKNFPSLRGCSLMSKDRINDEGLAYLGQLTKLDQLTLDEIKISDVGLSHLGKMVNLRSLILAHTGVSDAGLKYLVGLKNLKFLGLQATLVTTAGLAWMRNILPNCKVQDFSSV